MRKKKKAEFAIEFLDLVLEYDGAHQEALVAQASFLWADGRKPRAIELLESARRGAPENLAALRLLANLYTEAGRHNEGLAMDNLIVRLAPEDATAHYNLACSLSILERRDEAIAQLERAISLGYDDAAHMRKDPDLGNLHGDARFEVLIYRLKNAQGD